MEIYRVAFIGHREIDRIVYVENRIEGLARELLRTKDYVEFYVGRNGDYDISVASAIKRAQKASETSNSALILVLPYHVKVEEYYAEFYDGIWLPLETKTHYKAAITKRNEWMVEHADLLIAYVQNACGGAYHTVKYAEKKNVAYINLANAMD